MKKVKVRNSYPHFQRSPKAQHNARRREAKERLFARNSIDKVGNIFRLYFSHAPYFERLLRETAKHLKYEGKISWTPKELYGRKEAIKDIIKQTVKEMDEATLEIFKTIEDGYKPSELQQRNYLISLTKS